MALMVHADTRFGGDKRSELERPNGLRISRHERAVRESAKIATISREAVGLHPAITAGRDSPPE